MNANNTPRTGWQSLGKWVRVAIMGFLVVMVLGGCYWLITISMPAGTTTDGESVGRQEAALGALEENTATADNPVEIEVTRVVTEEVPMDADALVGPLFGGEEETRWMKEQVTPEGADNLVAIARTSNEPGAWNFYGSTPVTFVCPKSEVEYFVCTFDPGTGEPSEYVFGEGQEITAIGATIRRAPNYTGGSVDRADQMAFVRQTAANEFMNSCPGENEGYAFHTNIAYPDGFEAVCPGN